MRIQVRRAGIKSLLKEPGVKADLDRRARRVAAAAGPGHTIDTRLGRDRARSSVKTDSPEALRAEALHRNLTRSLDAARG